MAKTLGLDLGTNSIGWAVVEIEDRKYKLLDKGVRIFQEGVKIDKGVESSKAAERTGYRSARRIKFRRKLRKIETLKILVEYGYCPKLTDQELNDWRYKKLYPANLAFRNWWMTDDQDSEEDRKLKTKNPYYFRNLAVYKKLDLNEERNRFAIGRAFYHMVQRRGFLSNRLEATKENEGKVKESISKITEDKGEKTLGQYFYEKYLVGEKIRDIYTHRIEHYKQEFDRICTKQKLPDNIIDKLKRAIFYQRPLRSQKGLVGKCVFEPKKKRCPISRPEFEEYRMLCFINNIKVKTPNDEIMRELSNEEKTKILPLFFRKSSPYFNFEDIAKKIAPKNQQKYYKDRNKFPENWLFNFHMDTTVSACPTSTSFKNIFESKFIDNNLNFVKDNNGDTPKEIVDAWHALFSFDSDEKLLDFAKNRLRLTDEKSVEYSEIKLKQNYASLSLKAINNILPYLRERLTYSHAVFMANMVSCIPESIWTNLENRKFISDAILDIIRTHNYEKQATEVINGLIKNCKNNNEYWSEEAASIYEKDIDERLINSFGKEKYALISTIQQASLKQFAFEIFKKQMNKGRREFASLQTIDNKIKQFLSDNFALNTSGLEKLYHPAALDVFKSPNKDRHGNLLLNSPMVSSLKNPMAMRALHQLRKLVNELIIEGVIDANTKINIEMSRDLLNANERAGLKKWQAERKSKREKYAKLVKEHLKIEASENEILKYQLWEEQNKMCLYTGKNIGIEDFLGANPKYDIEHTIPRSLSFDDSQTNKTLCDNEFNRKTKKTKIPYELTNHIAILTRVEHWKENADKLEKQIKGLIKKANVAVDKDAKDKLIQERHKLVFERNYLLSKYRTFTMKEVSSGFKNSQLVDIGIITKYSRLYLNTLFPKVYTVKGNTVADFRKMWGLQSEYKKKERINHVHHCIDAITIACISKIQYEAMAQFYHDWEEYYYAGKGQKPKFDKPWNTFTEDVKTIEDDLLISHYTANVLPKKSKKTLRKGGKIVRDKDGNKVFLKGDSARGSLHKETFYGAIEREVSNKNGEVEKQIKYVVRKFLTDLEDSNIKNIVDETVQKIVLKAKNEEKLLLKRVEELEKQYKDATDKESENIKTEIVNIKNKISLLYSLPNKNGAPIPIKKVRIYCNDVTNPLKVKKQRDLSNKDYKQNYFAKNDGNYLMAIYEAQDRNGKYIRDFEIRNNIECAEYFKSSIQQTIKAQDIETFEGLLPLNKVKKQKLPLKAILKTGTLVILWEHLPQEIWDLSIEDIKKRMYKITSFEKDGRVQMRFHQTAKPDKELKSKSEINTNNSEEKLRLSISKFNALIEGVDFQITTLGKIIRI